MIRGENKLAPGKVGKAVQFSGDDQVDLPLGNYDREQPFSVSLWLKTPDVKDRAVVFHRSAAWTDAGSRGYELLIEDGRLKWSLIHFWPGNAISIAAKNPLPLNQWMHLVVTSDGSSRAAGLRLYVDGRAAEIEVVRDHLTKQISGGGNGGDNIALGARFRDHGFTHGLIDDFRVFTRELTPLEALAAFAPEQAADLLARSAKDLSTDDRNQIFEYYLAAIDAKWQKHLEALKSCAGNSTLRPMGSERSWSCGSCRGRNGPTCFSAASTTSIARRFIPTRLASCRRSPRACRETVSAWPAGSPTAAIRSPRG